jgi:hypothetical protein
MTIKEKRKEFEKIEYAIKGMKMEVWVKGQQKSDDPFLEGTFVKLDGDILLFKWVIMSDGTWNDDYKMDLRQFNWFNRSSFYKPPPVEIKDLGNGTLEMTVTWDFGIDPKTVKSIITKEVRESHKAASKAKTGEKKNQKNN